MSLSAILTLIAILFLATWLIISFRRIKNMPSVDKNENIIDLTDHDFTLQVSKGVSLVDFWASWCAPCRMMAPVLNELAEDAPDGVKICKVDVEQFQSLAAKYQVRGIPTMILFKNGKEINRFVGVKSKDFLSGVINKTLHNK